MPIDSTIFSHPRRVTTTLIPTDQITSLLWIGVSGFPQEDMFMKISYWNGIN